MATMRTFDVDPLGPNGAAEYQDYLLPGERIEAGYRGERATILFTDRRIVTVQLQVVISERIETTSISYRAVRLFSLNRGVNGEGRSEFRIALEHEPHPLHLRANPGTDFTPLQGLLAARIG
jgi:hypothetical protein